MPRKGQKKIDGMWTNAVSTILTSPIETATAIIILPECNCVDFDGQDFFCKTHEAVTLCPHCHCVKAEKLVNPYGVTNNYSCTICGHMYSRNMATGDYDYTP